MKENALGALTNITRYLWRDFGAVAQASELLLAYILMHRLDRVDIEEDCPRREADRAAAAAVTFCV